MDQIWNLNDENLVDFDDIHAVRNLKHNGLVAERIELKIVRRKDDESKHLVRAQIYYENPEEGKVRHLPKPMFSRCALTDADLKKLNKDFDPKMGRDALNALPATKVKDIFFRIGFYHVDDPENPGEKLYDADGNPVIACGRKWLSCTLADGTELEPSGDVIRFDE